MFSLLPDDQRVEVLLSIHLYKLLFASEASGRYNGVPFLFCGGLRSRGL